MKVRFVGNPHRPDFEKHYINIGRSIHVAIWEPGVAHELPPYPLRTGEATIAGRDEYDIESIDEEADDAVFRWRERRMT